MANTNTNITYKKKRFLFLGPTGVGKSTLINILFNDNVNKESLKEPAVVASTTSGVTAEFKTYCTYEFAYTDSIGFGDNRFTTEEIVTLVKQLIDNVLMGYNKIYLCVKYGRISRDIRLYLDLIISLFGEGCFNYCTIIFTHCNEGNINKEIFMTKNQNDGEIVQLINKVDNVIFGDLQSHENPQIDSFFKETRKRFFDLIKLDADKSSEYPYFSQPNDPRGWLQSICNVIEKLSVLNIPVEEIWSYITSITVVKVGCVNYFGDCTICRDNMCNTNSVYTSCGHCFHRICISSYSVQSRTCPVCIQPYTLMEVQPWIKTGMKLYRS